MSAAIRLLVDLQLQGFELRPSGDTVAFRPKDRMTPELLDRVRAHKAELLSMLQADPELGVPRVRPLSVSVLDLAASTAGACYACGSIIFWRLHEGQELVCAVCHPPDVRADGVSWRRRGAGGRP